MSKTLRCARCGGTLPTTRATAATPSVTEADVLAFLGPRVAEPPPRLSSVLRAALAATAPSWLRRPAPVGGA